MKIAIRYFASVREKLGLAQESVELPAHVATVGGVREWLVARGGAWAEALDGKRALRMAYDQQMADAATPVMDSGEVAFFPPVTGG
ncbi:MAG: molybdopterin converting factor subunit 1 [Burkholderiaceae bacterium]|nr:molybdopterin converting factor subunit 1 [Burkholderiaceae bacterium]